jgi:hypothetical protein
MLAGEAEDLRGTPLHMRKVTLAQRLSNPIGGFFLAV